MKIAYHPEYKYELPEGHRFPMEKYILLYEQLLYEGTAEHDNFFTPDRLTDEEILTTHTSEFLRKLIEQDFTRREERTIGFPMRAALFRRGRRIAKGTYLCAHHAMESGVALNIAGGTHHSFADHGEGFCILNDIAIASNLLLNEKSVRKILVIDLDVHQGNGTSKLFEKEDRVFTFSMHGEKNYPLRKQKSDLDIGLPDKTGDNEYLSILRTTLPSLLHSVIPDLIFYQSGVDIISSDKLGRLSLSIVGCKQRDEIVMQLAAEHQIPLAISMGGGYSPQVRDILEAHTNTFRTASSIFV